jgi:hypothetical protein
MDELMHLLEWMAAHTQRHPDHGMNCSCKDDVIRRIRLVLQSHRVLEEFRLVAQYVN